METEAAHYASHSGITTRASLFLYVVIYVFSTQKWNYRKVAGTNTSCLEPHPGFFRLLMKGIFDAYVL